MAKTSGSWSVSERELRPFRSLRREEGRGSEVKRKEEEAGEEEEMEHGGSGEETSHRGEGTQ